MGHDAAVGDRGPAEKTGVRVKGQSATLALDSDPFLWLISALIAVSVPVFAEPVRVGDIEISPDDFSATLSPEKRVAKCLSCHGSQAGGDIDFGPEVHFGTPALRGMREGYLRESLVAYRDGTRQHKEMSAVAAMLDDETIDFMARSFAAYEVPPMRTADELAALAKKDSLFEKGETIARQGMTQKRCAGVYRLPRPPRRGQ